MYSLHAGNVCTYFVLRALFQEKATKEIPLYIKDIIVKLEVPLLKSQYVIASITITTEAFVIVYYAKEAVLLVM